MVIDKKLVRSSSSVKARLLGTLAIIMFSVALMVCFPLSMMSVSEQLDAFRAENALHDIRIKTVKPIDEDTDIDNAVFEQRYVVDGDMCGGKLLHIASLTEKLDIALVTEGDSISERGDLLLDRMYAESNGISIGDKIDIMGKSFKVCGFYTSPDTILPTKTAESIMVSPESFGLATMSEEDIKSLGGFKTEYLIKLDNADNDIINELIETLHSEYTITDCKKAEEDNRVTYINGDLKLFSGDFIILPTIFIIIASFSCAAVISRIMKAEATQIGVLYALGYKRITLYFHYMIYPLAVCTAGIILGIVSGIALSPSIAGILKIRYLLPSFEMSIYSDVLLRAAILPAIFMEVICSVSVLFMLSRTPLELIKDEKTSSGGSTHIRLSGLSFGARFMIRSFLRNLPRELFLIGGIALSSMLMLTYVSMISSLSGALNESFDEILRYKYMYTFSVPQSESYDKVCLINTIPVLLDGDYVSISGISDEYSMMSYTNVDGGKTDFDQNIITNNIAGKYGISEGDTVTLTNSLNNEIYKIKIDKVCVSYVENFISVSLDKFNEMTGQPQGSHVIIASDRALEIADKSELISVETIDANRKGVSETIMPLKILLGILLITASAVSMIIIVITTSVIIEESRHTISLMKVFGYGEKRISRLVIDINSASAAVGYFISIPLVLKLSDKVFDFMSDTLGMYIPARLDIFLCIIGFVFVMLIFLAAKLFTRKRIFEASAAEAVKAKE